MATGARSPEGEALKRAVRWLSDQRREDPSRPRPRLIEEAGLRFDLSPAELQYLYDNWK